MKFDKNHIGHIPDSDSLKATEPVKKAEDSCKSKSKAELHLFNIRRMETHTSSLSLAFCQHYNMFAN